MRVVARILIASCAVILAQPAVAATAAEVEIVRLPAGGFKPDLVLDDAGVVHVAYVAAETETVRYGQKAPWEADGWYLRSTDGGRTFSTPLRINSEAGSLLGVGGRGPRLALGRSGRIHATWNAGPSMAYARLEAEATAFTPQQLIGTRTRALDGGGAIAADGEGRVYLLWHANDRADAEPTEVQRKLWLARSTDDGRSFAAEVAVRVPAEGGCGCCALGSAVDAAGNLYVLFRVAAQTVHRDLFLLASRDQGRSFAGSRIGAWQVAGCPGTTPSFTVSDRATIAVWENKGQVYAGLAKPDGTLDGILEPTGRAKGRGSATVAIAPDGTALMVWTESKGFTQPRLVGWQVFDAQGQPQGEPVVQAGVPAHGVVRAFARSEGGFAVIF